MKETMYSLAFTCNINCHTFFQIIITGSPNFHMKCIQVKAIMPKAQKKTEFSYLKVDIINYLLSVSFLWKVENEFNG